MEGIVKLGEEIWQKVLFVNYVLLQWKELWNQVKKYHFLTRMTL